MYYFIIRHNGTNIGVQLTNKKGNNYDVKELKVMKKIEMVFDLTFSLIAQVWYNFQPSKNH